MSGLNGGSGMLSIFISFSNQRNSVLLIQSEAHAAATMYIILDEVY